MSDYQDWQTPQAHANAIAATGVGLLNFRNALDSLTGQVIGAGATLTRPAVLIPQVGYELSITLKSGAGSTLPFADVTLTWSDSGTGQIVDIDRWWLAAGTTTGQTYAGAGPAGADTVTLSIGNSDTAAMTCTFALNMNSRVYTATKWIQVTTDTVAGFTAASYDQPSGILMSVSRSINSGAQQVRLMALYSGQVELFANSGGNFVVTVLATANQSGLATSVLYEFAGTATAPVIESIPLPQCVCAINLENTAGTTQNMAAIAVVSKFQP